MFIVHGQILTMSSTLNYDMPVEVNIFTKFVATPSQTVSSSMECLIEVNEDSKFSDIQFQTQLWGYLICFIILLLLLIIVLIYTKIYKYEY